MVWQDEGLYFTIGMNSIVLAVGGVLGLALHSRQRFHRILRPARPQSATAALFEQPAAILKSSGYRLSSAASATSAVADEPHTTARSRGAPEEDVRRSVGVAPALYVHGLRFMALVLLALCVSAVCLCCLAGSDDYLRIFNDRYDPQNCHTQRSFDACGELKPFCRWMAASVNATHHRWICTPEDRPGLTDLSVQNLTPDAWRVWFAGILIAVGGVLVGVVTVIHVDSTAALIQAAYVSGGQQVEPGTEERIPDDELYATAPQTHLPAAVLRSVAGRTVLVAGLPATARAAMDEATFFAMTCAEKGDARDRLMKSRDEAQVPTVATLDDLAVNAAADSRPSSSEDAPLLGHEAPDTAGQHSPPHPPRRASYGSDGDTHSFTIGADPSSPTAIGGGAVLGGDRRREGVLSMGATDRQVQDLGECSHVIARQSAVRGSATVIRQPPRGLEAAIEKERGLLETLADDVATEKAETDPAKKPVQKVVPLAGDGCCKRPGKVPAVDFDAKEIDALQNELETSLLPKRGNEKMAGAGFVAFDTCSAASAFVRQFNKERGVFSTAAASIAGDRAGIVWANLGVGTAQVYARMLVVTGAFVAFVFLWGVPVGFLGSLQSLASIPGIGGPFRDMIASLPPTAVGLLSAYLPTIVLAVFNVLLPMLLRAFGHAAGNRTKDQEFASVLTMCAVFSIMSGIVIQAALQGGLSQLAGVISEPSFATVAALLVAVVSPQGGYWYAYLISAACLANVVRFLSPAPIVKALALGKLAKRQEQYDRIFALREIDYPFYSGRHLFFFAIAMLLHATVPLLVPFGCLYCLVTYSVERSLILDSARRDTRTIVDFRWVKLHLHAVLALHTVGATGAVLVCFLKESVAGGAIAVIGVVASAGAHGYVHWRLRAVIDPTPEQVADMEYEVALRDAVPASPGATPARPGLPGGRSSSSSATNTVRFPLRHEPLYAIYKLDRSVVATTLSGTEPAAVDTTWPRQQAQLAASAAAAAENDDRPSAAAAEGPTAAPAATSVSPPNPLSASDRRLLLVNNEEPQPERVMEVSL